MRKETGSRLPCCRPAGGPRPRPASASSSSAARTATLILPRDRRSERWPRSSAWRSTATAVFPTRDGAIYSFLGTRIQSVHQLLPHDRIVLGDLEDRLLLVDAKALLLDGLLSLLVRLIRAAADKYSRACVSRLSNGLISDLFGLSSERHPRYAVPTSETNRATRHGDRHGASPFRG